MGGFVDWLWRRCRQRYLLVCGALLTALYGFGVTAPVVGSVGPFFGLDLRECLIWGALTLGCLVLGLVGAAWSARGQLAPIAAWVRGDRSDPVGAWEAVLVAPQVIGLRAGTLQLIGLLIVPNPYFFDVGHTNAVEAVLGLVGVATVVTGAGFFTAILLVPLLRPLLAEVQEELPAGVAVPKTGLSLERRLLGFFGLTSAGAAISAPLGAFHAHAREARWDLVIGFTLVITAYLAVLARIAVRSWIRNPLRELLEATRRVGRGDLTLPVAVMSSDDLGELAVAFNDMQVGLLQREALHDAFGSYVDPALAQRLLDSGSSMFEGESLALSVLFADVRDFTKFSEGASPAEAVELLNRLFGVMVPVLRQHGGHVNRYQGDGLLAVFGAPQPLREHADSAVGAAVEIQRRVRAEFGGELRLGIGINTGPVIAGTVGGGGRHEFTVIGDTVNVASRVEQLTKETGDPILITEATRVALSAPRPRSTKRGEFEVRGKATRLTLHAVNPFPRSTR